MQKILIINTVALASLFLGIGGAYADQECSTSPTGPMTVCTGSTPFCAYPDTGMWRIGTGTCQDTQPTYHNRSASRPTPTNIPNNPVANPAMPGPTVMPTLTCPTGYTLTGGVCTPDCLGTMLPPRVSYEAPTSNNGTGNVFEAFWNFLTHKR